MAVTQLGGAYTSIATTPGLSDNTVKTMYDFAIAKLFRAAPLYRTWCDKGPERPNGPGQTIQLQKYDWLSAATVTAAKTPLNEENDVDSIKLPPTLTVDLTVNEYGITVTRTKKLKYFSFADVDTYAAEAVGNHLIDWYDEMVQDVMDGATNVIRAAGRAADNLITASDKFVAADVRKAVTALRSRNVPTMDGQFYVAGVHPHTIHDLREETGSGSWRVPSEYGVSQSQIWNGEFGTFEGARFVQNTRTRRTATGASSAQVYRNWFLGKEAVAERVVEEPSFVISPVLDKLARFRTVGWYGVLGWVLYRQESLQVVKSGSSVSTLA